MRCSVAAVTPPLPLSARDTEATETFASRATSLIVIVTALPHGVGPMAGERNVNVFIAACKVPPRPDLHCSKAGTTTTPSPRRCTTWRRVRGRRDRRQIRLRWVIGTDAHRVQGHASDCTPAHRSDVQPSRLPNPKATKRFH